VDSVSGSIDVQACSFHTQLVGRSCTKRVGLPVSHSATNVQQQQPPQHRNESSEPFLMIDSGLKQQGDDDEVPSRMKKSASSPVLSASSKDSAGSSSRTVTPGFLSEPPPYTSLPPPLVSPSLHATEGPLSTQRVSMQLSGYQRTDEEHRGRKSEGEEMVYASRSTLASKHVNSDRHLSPLSHSSSTSLRQSLRGSHTRGRPYPHVPPSSRMRQGNGTSLRHRIFATTRMSSRHVEGGDGDTDSDWETDGKVICTTPGVMCAGETETETDEPVSVFLERDRAHVDGNFAQVTTFTYCTRFTIFEVIKFFLGRRIDTFCDASMAMAFI
jgi:hypothetical protein